MADGGKGGFDWVTGADALPMLGGEVEECHQLFAVLLQAQRRLGIFGLVDFDEQIERLFPIVFGLDRLLNRLHRETVIYRLTA